MTLTRFVTKSAFRNRRRSVLTVLSIAFSLLLLTLMMTVWQSWYVDKGEGQSLQRLVTRHRVSLTQNLPVYYREKMRTVPGVVAIAPMQWFGGQYKDEKGGELLRAVWHGSERDLPGDDRFQNPRRSTGRVAARSGRMRGGQ